MRRIVLLAVLLAAGLAGCGGGSSGSTTSAPSTPATTPSTPATTSTQSSAIDVTLHAPKRPPQAGTPWPVRITARTKAGEPVDGTVSYAFLFGGAVVARRPAKPHNGHMTNGTYRDTIKFPPRAAGIPITLRVIVKSGGRTGTTDRQVKVQPA